MMNAYYDLKLNLKSMDRKYAHISNVIYLLNSRTKGNTITL